MSIINPNIIIRRAINYINDKYLLDKKHIDFLEEINTSHNQHDYRLYMFEYPRLTIYNPYDTIIITIDPALAYVDRHDLDTQVTFKITIYHDQDDNQDGPIFWEIFNKKQLLKFLSKQNIELIVYEYNRNMNKDLYRCEPQEGHDNCYPNTHLNYLGRHAKKYLKQKPWSRKRQANSIGYKKKLLLDEYKSLPENVITTNFPGGPDYRKKRQLYNK